MHQRLCFPVNHFPPSIPQRTRYYSKEFSVERLKKWLDQLPEPIRNPIFSVDVGTESGIVRARFKASQGKMILFTVPNVEEVRSRLVEFAPEDAYYDRNLYEDKEKCIACKKVKDTKCSKCTNIIGQHLMFDVDPENIDCPNCGTLEERIKNRSMYRFCYICFRKAAMYTKRLHGLLLEKGYWQTEVVYSGRGFHVYVGDPESYVMTIEKRDELARWARDEQKIPIDPWVTRGGTRFARLPYSLHGLVGKIVQPVKPSEIMDLNPSRDIRLTPTSIKSEKKI